jgi:nucleoid-associated protein YgaU
VFRRLIAPLGTITLLAVIARALTWAGGPSIAALTDGTATFDEALGGVAAIGAWVLLGWVVLVLAGTALAAVPGFVGRASSRVVGAITPVAARRAARLALGVAVAAGPVALSAGPAAAHGPGSADGPIATQLVGEAPDLPLVERPTRPDQTPRPAEPLSVAASADALPSTSLDAGQSSTDRDRSEQAAEPVPEAPAHVVVQRGDSLWTIAARHLGPDASDAQIAAAWPRWYEANRHVIGDDPDLIVPGLTLTPPATS